MAKKGVRAPYLLAHLINNRPEYESCEEFSHRIGLTYTLDTDRVMKRSDVGCGLMYRVAKVFGYQLILYNPKPPKDMESIYVIGEGKMRIMPRERKGKYQLKKDAYTGEIYRVPRKYKKQRFIKVEKKI